MRLIRDERGGILGKTLVLVIIVFALVGVIVIDGGSIFFTSLHLSDAADAAAQDAAGTYAIKHDTAAACKTAQDTLDSQFPGVTAVCSSITVDPSNGALTLTVEQTATTVVLKYIGPLKKYATVHVSSTSSPPTG